MILGIVKNQTGPYQYKCGDAPPNVERSAIYTMNSILLALGVLVIAGTVIDKVREIHESYLDRYDRWINHYVIRLNRNLS